MWAYDSGSINQCCVAYCGTYFSSLLLLPGSQHWHWLSSHTTKGFFSLLLSPSTRCNWLATRTLLLSHQGDISPICLAFFMRWWRRRSQRNSDMGEHSSKHIHLVSFGCGERGENPKRRRRRNRAAFAYWYEFACLLVGFFVSSALFSV